MTAQPSKRTWTKRRSDAALAFCGLLVLYVVAFRSDSPIAETVLAYSYGLAAAVLGIYQAVGHLDMRASKPSDEGEKCS